jgi:hypothetical protein
MTSRDSAKRPGSGIARVARAWRALPPDRQLAASAALGLCLTLFLPWYQETGFASGKKLQTTSASLTGWHAFSWVEAAVLLVAVSVLTLLFLRAEGRAFHLPGGDGFIVMAAGGWTCALVIWRILDKQGTTSNSQFGTTFGIKWGIFTALAVAAALTYAGTRIRAAHLPEPLLPGEEPGGGGRVGRSREAPAGSRRARRAAPAAAGAAGGAPAGTTRASAPPAAGAPAGGAPGGVTAVGAEPSKAKRARRATWAEPVTWEDPTVLSEPARATGPEPARAKAPTEATDPPTRPMEPTDIVEPPISGGQARLPRASKDEPATETLGRLPARSTPEPPAASPRGRRQASAQLSISTDDEPPA